MTIPRSSHLILGPRKNFKGGTISRISGVSVFVGGNGSGKSSLLESLFERSLETSEDGIAVVFTSGPNENFSELYGKFVRRLKKDLTLIKSLNLKAFLFDLSWAPLLVTVAAFLNRDEQSRSLTSNFLYSRGYILKDLRMKVKIPRSLIEDVKSDKLEDDGSSLLTSAFVLIIEKLVGTEILEMFEGTSKTVCFSQSISGSILKNSNYQLSPQLYSALLEIVEVIGPVIRRTRPTPILNLRKEAIRSLIAAFALGNINGKIFDLSKVDLTLTRSNDTEMSLRHLSDGEYQLLMSSAILDIFDEPNTTLIMDEIDSHVHQKAVPYLWETVGTAKASVFTTTHNPTSLKYCDFTRVQALSEGAILTGVSLQEEYSKIFDGTEAVNRVMALGFRNFSNLVVLDGFKDWLIFVALIKKKLGDQFDKRLETGVTIHKVTSDQSTDYSINNPKARFVADLMSYFKKELDENQLRGKALKKIIVICDRDTRDFSSRYGNAEGFNLVSETITIPHEGRGSHIVPSVHLSWNRREIENYLLLPELLANSTDEEIIGRVGTTNITQSVAQIRRAIAHGDEETLATVDCKAFVSKIICNTSGGVGADLGFSQTLLVSALKNVAPQHISDYLVKMYERIRAELFS